MLLPCLVSCSAPYGDCIQARHWICGTAVGAEGRCVLHQSDTYCHKVNKYFWHVDEQVPSTSLLKYLKNLHECPATLLSATADLSFLHDADAFCTPSTTTAAVHTRHVS